jgi:hypothetical protein
MRVRITKLPLDKAAYGKQVDGSLSLKPGAFGGADYTARDKTFYKGTKDSIGAVPREEANLEAEGGETAFGPISGQSIPDHLKIRGKRHSAGGVPLNLPDDTFIFSDTASLKINDPSVLAMFNKGPKKGGYTPAELAKPYNINKYKSILMDPDTGKLERDTATIMIKNFIMKLGALALVQESMKGFPQGIPEMAKPYMEANGIKEEDLMPELKAQAEALAQQQPGMAPQMPQEQNPMAAQEMQQMAPQQAMQADQAMMQQGQQGYPPQMPGGAPVASPEMMQQMAGQGSMPPPEMMQDPNMMAYGGIPYAAYGMEMGGFDFPYDPNQMAYGGIAKFQGIGKSQVTVNDIPASKTPTKPDGTWTSGTVSGAGAGAEGYYRSTPGAERTYVGGRAIPGGGSRPSSGWAGSMCDRLMQGATIAQLVSEGHGTTSGLTSLLADCIPEAEAKFAAKDEAVYLEPDGTVVTDEITDEVVDGTVEETYTDKETLTCKCTDPMTGEVTEFAITSEEECTCQDGSQGQLSQGMAMGQPPHWSIPAKRNIMANALMQVNPAASNVVIPNRAQAQGTYEEYQTKTDQALAANAQMQKAILTGYAGSTGQKQSMIKDAMANSLRLSMEAVAGVQSRNVDRQTAVNNQNATIDSTNAMARASGLTQALDNQKVRKDTRTGNVNKRLFNTMRSMSDADQEMAARQQMNVTTPQYESEYDYGFIRPTGVQKPFSGSTNASLDDRIQHYLAKTGDYATAFDMAYKEARISSKYGGQRMNDGGYVLGSNVFPFIL